MGLISLNSDNAIILSSMTHIPYPVWVDQSDRYQELFSGTNLLPKEDVAYSIGIYGIDSKKPSWRMPFFRSVQDSVKVEGYRIRVIVNVDL